MNLLWGSHFKNLGAAFPEMFATGKFVDVTLACDGRRIHCHRVVLAANSSFFSDLLEENPAQHPIIILPRDVKFWMIQTLVEFMYKGEVTVSEADFQELLNCAQILQIHSFSRDEACQGENSMKEDDEEEFISDFKTERTELPEECLSINRIFVHQSSPESPGDSVKPPPPFDLSPSQVCAPTLLETVRDFVESQASCSFKPISRQSHIPAKQRKRKTAMAICMEPDAPGNSFESPPPDFFLSRTGHPRKFDAKNMWLAMMGVKNGLPITRSARIHKVSVRSLRRFMTRYGIKSSFPTPAGLQKYLLTKNSQRDE
ncbi:hypothetical protein DMENIID0001_164080 [Sergentomyia squamirostris]